VLQRSDLQFVIPALVVAEVTHFIGTRMDACVEADWVRRLARLDIESPLAEEWLRIADLVEQYGDFPLGTTDASVVALAERLETDLIVTFDRRHFGAVRPTHVESFRLLPSDSHDRTR
jgi:predicted nucleic acid-binding protein